MTTKISLITATVGAALLFAVPAWGESWGSDRQGGTVGASPDLVDLLAAKNGTVDNTGIGGYVKLAVESNRPYAACSGRGACAPRAFELAREQTFVGAAHFDSPSGSNGAIEWPQMGVGFVTGILLALGLVLGLRHGRARPLAQ